MIRRALSALVVLVLLAGCGGAAGGEDGTAQLWVTRDRGAKLLVDTEVAGRADADARSRFEGRRRDSLRRPLRPGRERDRRQPRRAARLVLVRERVRGRPQRGLVPPPGRRCRLARLPRLATGGGGARRRGRVPGAVPARLRGEDAAGRNPLRPRLREAGAEARRGPRSERRSHRSGRPCRPARMCSRCVGGASSLTAELLGETAGDPVRFVWRGDPTPERRYTVP